MSKLWLVQRLERRDSDRPGFDGMFACEYMGSAEFEFNALPDSLKRIRSQQVDWDAFDIDLAVDQAWKSGSNQITRTVYFVGPDPVLADFADDLELWLNNGAPSKELSYFPEAFTKTGHPWQECTSAWWAVDEDVMFTLDRQIVQDLWEAIAS